MEILSKCEDEKPIDIGHYLKKCFSFIEKSFRLQLIIRNNFLSQLFEYSIRFLSILCEPFIFEKLLQGNVFEVYNILIIITAFGRTEK